MRTPNNLIRNVIRNTADGANYNQDHCNHLFYQGGTATGSCANGYGVCCIVTLNCGGVTSTNNSYLIKVGIIYKQS